MKLELYKKENQLTRAWFSHFDSETEKQGTTIY